MRIDEKTVKRMIALVKALSGAQYSKTIWPEGLYAEAKDIAKLLPDPDLAAANMIATHTLPGWDQSSYAYNKAIEVALAGIRHGRANP